MLTALTGGEGRWDARGRYRETVRCDVMSLTRLEAEADAARAHAEAYERLVVPALFAGWAEALVELAGLAEGDRVLDVACGSGVVARTVAERHDGGVTGVDRDPAMLATARRRDDRVRWCTADVHELPFADRAFDVVLCQQAVQFFGAPDVALREMHRVVRDGGRVAVASWRGVRDPAASSALAGTLARHLPDALGQLAAPCAFEHPGKLGEGLAGVGLRVTHTGVLVQRLGTDSPREVLEIVGLLTTLKPWLDELATNRLDALLEDLERALHDAVTGEPLAIPVEASVAIGAR